MAGTDDIADAGMQAFDEEHRQVRSPGERPDWEGVEEAQAGADDAEGTGDEETVAPGTQSPANEPIGSTMGEPDAFGAGASDSDRTNGNWADADDAGASDTGIQPREGEESGRDDPFDGGSAR